jgi:hypothetical protein
VFASNPNFSCWNHIVCHVWWLDPLFFTVKVYIFLFRWTLGFRQGTRHGSGTPPPRHDRQRRPPRRRGPGSPGIATWAPCFTHQKWPKPWGSPINDQKMRGYERVKPDFYMLKHGGYTMMFCALIFFLMRLNTTWQVQTRNMTQNGIDQTNMRVMDCITSKHEGLTMNMEVLVRDPSRWLWI